MTETINTFKKDDGKLIEYFKIHVNSPMSGFRFYRTVVEYFFNSYTLEVFNEGGWVVVANHTNVNAPWIRYESWMRRADAIPVKERFEMMQQCSDALKAFAEHLTNEGF